MGPLTVFLIGAGAALIGKEPAKRGLKSVVRGVIKTRIEIEDAVSSVRRDLEQTAASVRDDAKKSGLAEN